MKIPTINPLQLYIAGGLVAVVGLAWLLKKGNAQALGSAVGGAAVGAVVGTVSGASKAVVAAADDPQTNPLYDAGSWLGSVVYDWTH